MTRKYDILLPKKDTLNSYYSNETDKLERLSDASRINIFVGSNNSGKSRFIRELLNSDLQTIDLKNRQIL